MKYQVLISLKKKRKKYSTLSSAAVVIGALRLKGYVALNGQTIGMLSVTESCKTSSPHLSNRPLKGPFLRNDIDRLTAKFNFPVHEYCSQKTGF